MSRPLLSALVLLAVSVALSGCLTPTAKVAPSAAVLEARKRVAQKVETCQATPLSEVSPALATFPYDEAQLDASGAAAVRRVAAWLACHPQTPVAVLPGADNHGDAAHRQDLAARRGQAAVAALRADGATAAVVHLLAMDAPDTLTGPHVVIQAQGRGW